MRSIRLSLLLYFLGLLALALGTASVLAYETTQRTLQAKKAATEKLIHNQCEQSCREEENRLDQELRFQALALAKQVRGSFRTHRSHYLRQHAVALLMTTPPLVPSGYVQIPILVASFRGPLFNEVLRRNPAEIKVNEDDLPGHAEQQADYFQIDSNWGSSYRSHSLGDRRFPHDPAAFFPDHVVHTQFDDLSLDGGLKVRRVLLKTPVPRSWMTLIIQYAYDVKRREAARAKVQHRRDEELAALAAETDADQARVLSRLLLIGSLTFLAALAGSFWLVRLGLLPLHRLSDAVSKISPRDFLLPFREKRLPGELKPIVQRLQSTLDLLKRAFAREKQATADISHELRTPLAVLLTTSELGLRKPRSAEQYREMLQDCRATALQMNDVVQRLLTLARLDAGVDPLRSKPVDICQLADQCVALVRPLAEARGLTLTVDKPLTLPLTGDPDKLREVLNNLLHNAIQYNRPQGRIDVRLLHRDGRVGMEVSDTGIGIDPEARGQIFERFYRTDPSRSGDGLHAGLGLALVKEYVNLMGGSVDVESVLGQGSTFRVHLPV